ncbi:hypothetical protein ABT279_44310 [Amycolatopsis sp. NPDC000673]|uniref:hypothetical protein n=1 Tax=unclassified Amycolatopsis TaxID=2618356 RepID=UPI00331D365D
MRGYARLLNESPKPAKIGNVLHPVADVSSAVRCYAETFGLPAKFVDGDRYAALSTLVAGGGTVVRQYERWPAILGATRSSFTDRSDRLKNGRGCVGRSHRRRRRSDVSRRPRVRLITNNPEKYRGLAEYGLHLTEQVAVRPGRNSAEPPD